ncbi:glycosyltransferase [Christiangramia sediminicola]|uniref:Glycosyltransferase n=1 Tax=Christiangramia sediminicola TaxID=3073267 RepID=A0ABU1EMT8_9FLAO|nr:glycosyltransferase [Christiangramia sp. SM2212]MDR5589700.1 glycosyltransferase [Christiangramia sp. SM2212]
MNIAICSPNKNAYSETFIQAHKEFLTGTIFYYYDGELPTRVEGGVVINSRRRRIIDIFKGHFRLNQFSLAEQALMKSFEINKIDVVLAEYGPVGTRLVSICKELAIPLIVHFHGYDASRYEVIKLNENYRELFNYAFKVIAVSKKMYGDLLDLGCPKEKLVYNVYGPRVEFLKIVPNFSKMQFVSIGRFVDKKAPYYLILSFRKVLEKFPEAKLVMAGDGELWDSCKNLVKYYHLENNVSFPGVISRNNFMVLLSESLALVQHSITAGDGDMEGTPLSILEASAAGLPVISTVHGGIPDVITDNEHGFLVKEHSVDLMSDRMIELLSNPGLAKEMGENGKKNISSNFRLDDHINSINNILLAACS